MWAQPTRETFRNLPEGSREGQGMGEPEGRGLVCQGEPQALKEAAEQNHRSLNGTGPSPSSGGQGTTIGQPVGYVRDSTAAPARAFKSPLRRRRASKLLAQGVSEAEVAWRVGAHRQSVSRWARALAERCTAALKHPGRAGRKPRLGPRELKRIGRALKRGPGAFGYDT